MGDNPFRMHWVYVLGGDDYRRLAHVWCQRKTVQGKRYAVIESAQDEVAANRLTHVGVNDVVYVYGPMTPEAPYRIGNTPLSPPALAALIEAEGLPANHRNLKIFASHSGDLAQVPEQQGVFAELAQQAMASRFPFLQVYGYRGEVSPEGHASHKSAGMEEGEDPSAIPSHEWEGRGLRAQANRAIFGPAVPEPGDGQ